MRRCIYYRIATATPDDNNHDDDTRSSNEAATRIKLRIILRWRCRRLCKYSVSPGFNLTFVAYGEAVLGNHFPILRLNHHVFNALHGHRRRRFGPRPLCVRLRGFAVQGPNGHHKGTWPGRLYHADGAGKFAPIRGFIFAFADIKPWIGRSVCWFGRGNLRCCCGWRGRFGTKSVGESF